jgi:hypothetical protein
MALEDILMDEAKRLYPVGTRFVPAHMGQSEQTWCVITDDSEFKYNGGDPDITSMVDGKAWIPAKRLEPSKYGNTEYNRCVYHNGKWAKRLDPLPVTELKQLPIFN